MRALALLSLVAFLAVPSQAQSSKSFEFERAGLSLEVPYPYLLQTSCEIPAALVAEEGASFACSDLSKDPSQELRTALYFFVNEPEYRVLSLAVRHDLSGAERAEWAAGPRALAGFGGTFTPAEASAWTDGPASAALWREGTGAGVALYGCEGWRCYRVFLGGEAADLAANPGDYRAVLDGVRVHPLSAPVAPLSLAEGSRQ